MFPNITRNELKGKMDRGERFELVETLPEAAYKQVHLPGAANLPLDKLRKLAPDLLPDKDCEIVVYCASRSCDASEVASGELAKMGYRNVKTYRDGKADWVH